MFGIHQSTRAPETFGGEAAIKGTRAEQALAEPSNEMAGASPSGSHPSRPDDSYEENWASTQKSNKSSSPTGSSTPAMPNPSSTAEIEDTNGALHFTRSRRSDKTDIKSNGSDGEMRGDHSKFTDSIPTAILDETAHLMARLDKHSYERALLQDANRILEDCVFPMSFPWQHPVVSVIKNVPRDIDEMPAIVQIDDEAFVPFENGNFGYGAFEVGKDRRWMKTLNNGEDNYDFRAAARRSNDVGTIELTVLARPSSVEPLGKPLCEAATEDLPSCDRKVDSLVMTNKIQGMASVLAQRRKRRRSHLTSVADGISTSDSDMDLDDVLKAGEKSYQTFRSLQASKKVKVDISFDNVKKLFLSVRFNSVSSRSSILTNSTISSLSQESAHFSAMGRPILCTAVLPDQGDPTRKILSLDSPDGRQNGVSVSESEGTRERDAGKRRQSHGKRSSARRSRLLWTKVTTVSREGGGVVAVASADNVASPGIVGLSASRNRSVYWSTLTGERLEQTSYRQPTELKLGVRINGILLQERSTYSSTSLNSPVDTMSIASIGVRRKGGLLNAEDPELPTNDEVVAAAIEAACYSIEQQRRARDESSGQCMLSCQKLLDSILRRNKRISGGKSRKSKIVSDKESQGASINPPIIPYNGRTPPHLDCIPLNDGHIRVVCTSPGTLERTWVCEILNKVSRGEGEKSRVCSICWTGDDLRSGLWVEECCECGLLAHVSCCSNQGKRGPRRGIGNNGREAFDAPSHNGSIASNGTMDPTHESHTSRSGTQPAIQNKSDCPDEKMLWTCAACCRLWDSNAGNQPESSLNSQHVEPATGDGRRRESKLPYRFQSDHECVTKPHIEPHHDGTHSRVAAQGARCLLCPHSGGAMSPFQSTGGWAHEVCRIWTGSHPMSSHSVTKSKCNGTNDKATSPDSPSTRMSRLCALCGIGDESATSGVVKCAANGCEVFFHPMCALLVSKLAEPEDGVAADDMEGRKRHDAYLCGLYTLDVLQFARIEGAGRRELGNAKSCILPLAFCGLHNQDRESTFYGGYPGGLHISQAMRIPRFQT